MGYWSERGGMGYRSERSRVTGERGEMRFALEPAGGVGEVGGWVERSRGFWEEGVLPQNPSRSVLERLKEEFREAFLGRCFAPESPYYYLRSSTCFNHVNQAGGSRLFHKLLYLQTTQTDYKIFQ